MTAILVIFAGRQLAGPPLAGAKHSHQMHKILLPNTVTCKKNNRKEIRKGKKKKERKDVKCLRGMFAEEIVDIS